MIYLDENQIGQHSLLDQLFRQVEEKNKLNIIEALKPKFSKDGDHYCFLYGEFPNDCVVGFGDTPAMAMDDFCQNFYNQKAK